MPSGNEKNKTPRGDESVDFGAFVEESVQRTSNALKGEGSTSAPAPKRPGGERKIDRARDHSYWRKKAADAGIPTDIEDDELPPPAPRRNRYLVGPDDESDEFHDAHEFAGNGGGFSETINHYFNGDDGNRNRIIAAVFFVLLLLAIVWGMMRLFSDDGGGEVDPTPTPTTVVVGPSTPQPGVTETPVVTPAETQTPEIKRGGDNQRGSAPAPPGTVVAQIDITNDVARSCTGLCLVRMEGPDHPSALADAGARASWSNDDVAWVVVTPVQAQVLSDTQSLTLVANDPQTYNLYVVVASDDRDEPSDITPHGEIVDQTDGVYLVRWGWVPAVVKPVTDWGYAVFKIAPAPPDSIAAPGINGPATDVSGWELMEQIDVSNIERTTNDLVHIGELDNSDWGTRYYEFAGNQIAADYLYQELESYGLTVWYEDFITWDGYLLVNVVAEIPGEDSSKVYAMMAHFDTINLDNPRVAPGADDNASGIATVLETTRILAGYELTHPVRIVFVNAEEVGILGAPAWARLANHEGVPIAGVFNVDSVASVRNRPTIVTNADANSSWMQAVLTRVNNSYDLQENLDHQQSTVIVADDNMVRAEGIPAIMIARELYGLSDYHHTAEDIPANFSIGAITDTTRIVLLAVWELAK